MVLGGSINGDWINCPNGESAKGNRIKKNEMKKEKNEKKEKKI